MSIVNMFRNDCSEPRQVRSDSFTIPGLKILRSPETPTPAGSRPRLATSSSASIASALQSPASQWQAAEHGYPGKDMWNLRIQTPQQACPSAPTRAESSSRSQPVSDHADCSGWVCAVYTAKDVDKQVGVCLVNVILGQCVVGQFSDTQMHGHLTYLVHTYEPSVILMPASQSRTRNGSMTSKKELFSWIEDTKGNVKILPRSVFNPSKGSSTLSRAILDDGAAQHTTASDSNIACLATGQTPLHRSLIATAIQPLALAAAGAAFTYLERDCQVDIRDLSLIARRYHPEGTIMIDHKTCNELELVRNAITGKESNSLMGILNCCSTLMGSRLLRMNILQPLAAAEDIDFRLDAIEDLKANIERYMGVRETLKAFGSKKIDVDKVVASVLATHTAATKTEAKMAKTTEKKLSNVIAVRNFLQAMETIAMQLSGTKSALLGAFGALFGQDCLVQLGASISEAVNEDILTSATRAPLSSTNARLFSIKSGRNKVLDAARQTYHENTADALDKCHAYTEAYNLPFKAVFSSSGVTGYHLEIPSGVIRSRNLAREFISFGASKGKTQMQKLTTLDLKKCNQRLSDAMTEVFLLSQLVVEELCDEIKKNAQALYRASEALAFLDVIMSLTHIAGSGMYVRPSFGDSLAIEKGRHPLLDRKNPDGTVPNDTHISDSKSFLLLTGANNAGKTTYLKQVALLQIMARIGSFVPADKAVFAPLSRILARLNNTDEPEANLSAYANEIKTTLMIVGTATPDSLILIDELGRNTSTHEGLGIAHAVAEVLIGRHVPTILSTHFLPLVRTLSPYPAVISRHFEVGVAMDDAGQGTARFAHRLVSEVDQSVGYGLTIAKSCGLPSSLQDDAAAIAARLQSGPSKSNATARNDIVPLTRTPSPRTSIDLDLCPLWDGDVDEQDQERERGSVVHDTGDLDDLDDDDSTTFADLASEYFNDLHERLYA